MDYWLHTGDYSQDARFLVAETMLPMLTVAGNCDKPIGIANLDEFLVLEDKRIWLTHVAIPNDPTNGGRALSILQAAGLLKLKDGVGVGGTVADVVENPKGLEFVEVEAALLPRTLDDVALSVINSNFAMVILLLQISILRLIFVKFPLKAVIGKMANG